LHSNRETRNTETLTMSRHKLLVALITTLICPQSILCGIQQIDNRDIEAFSQAASSVLEKAVNEFKNLRVAVSAKNVNFFDDYIDGLIKSADGEWMVKILNRNMKIDSKTEKIFVPGASLHLIESLEMYLNYSKAITAFNGRSGHLYLTYVHQASIDEITNNTNWDKYSYPKQYFIVNAGGDFIDLNVIVKYTETACDEMQTQLVNRFSKKDMKWMEIMPPVNLEVEFYWCNLFFNIQNHAEGVKIGKEDNITNDLTISGPLEKIMNATAEYSNFEMIFTNFEQMFENNSTFSHALEIMPQFYEHHEVVQFFNNELFFIIPPGELYCDWEVLLLPFDTATWCLIIATFGSAFGFIIVTKLFGSSTVRNFTFGRNISSPALNVLIAFYGLSQGIVPRRNFARFLLMLFILWSLIIRTGYQGIMFEHLQTDKHKPGIQSINELLLKNFTCFASFRHKMLIGENFRNLFQIKLTEIGDSEKAYLYTLDTWEKNLDSYLNSSRSESILIADTFKVIVHNKNNVNATFIIMKERIMSFHGGIATFLVPFLTATIRSVVLQLTENGLIDHWLAEMYDFKHLRPVPEPKEPEVLTLEHLAIGFKLFGIAVAFCIAVFVIEVVKEIIKFWRVYPYID